MNITETDTEVLKGRYCDADEHGLCPECGARMEEADRLDDGGGFVFIWLQCTRPDCEGGWLQKKPIPSLMRT